jgi:hypothetical protein
MATQASRPESPECRTEIAPRASLRPCALCVTVVASLSWFCRRTNRWPQTSASTREPRGYRGLSFWRANVQRRSRCKILIDQLTARMGDKAKPLVSSPGPAALLSMNSAFLCWPSLRENSKCSQIILRLTVKGRWTNRPPYGQKDRCPCRNNQNEQNAECARGIDSSQ